ncbi:hypothetical protein E2F47_01795 [Mycobacterium eburneum]|nr:hypothetical protein [Mycobacterium eburneum]TDH57527.1 hypothetical protein E2F47_01795 [Mycobacterium eburneum]
MSDETPEFASLLLNHAKGRAHDEASAKLREAVEAVRNTGKSAKVTVELSIEPVAKIPNAYRIQDKVTSKIPEEPRTSMWFADDNGGLHRNDPNQRSLYDDVESDRDTAAGTHH